MIKNMNMTTAPPGVDSGPLNDHALIEIQLHEELNILEVVDICNK